MRQILEERFKHALMNDKFATLLTIIATMPAISAHTMRQNLHNYLGVPPALWRGSGCTLYPQTRLGDAASIPNAALRAKHTTLPKSNKYLTNHIQ